jgi:DNA-binding HxlR family transcriptional regulator
LDYPSQIEYTETVPAPLGYQSFCPVGAALNVVGERWALLIVRDLFLGPRRYSELLKGLGGIGTDILAARLKTLQEHGIVRQVGSGRTQQYELTDSGKQLGPVLRELARWGADRLRLPADPAEIPLRVPLTSVILGGAPYPPRATGTYEVRVEDEAVRIAVEGGSVQASANGEPDATIEVTRPGLRALILGARPSDIERAGNLAIRGDRRPAHALLRALSGPPLLAALRPQLEAAAGGEHEGQRRLGG